MRERIASALSLLLLAALAVFLLWQQPKMGRIEGIARFGPDKRPLSGVRISLEPTDYESGLPSLSTRTDPGGHFTLRGVPVGKYTLTAIGEHHRGKEIAVNVTEAQTGQHEFVLTRSEPDLNVAEVRQPVFTSRETPYLPVQGYGVPGDHIKITLWRTKLSTALNAPGASEALQQLSNTYEGALPTFPAALTASRPKRVAETTLKIAQTDREGFFLQRLKLPLDEKTKRHGLYLIRVEASPGQSPSPSETRRGLGEGEASNASTRVRAVCSWALITDTALVIKRGPAGTVLAYVSDLTTGQPVAGAKVGSSVTDTDGLAALEEDPKRMIAVRGDDEAILHLPTTRTENRGSLVMHAWTDRTIYRPGHTVQWKAAIRRREAREGRYTLAGALAVTATVLDARGGELKKETLALGATGALSGSFDVSPEAETGEFTLKIEADGETYTKDVTVAAYRKPEFEASAIPEKPAYLHGERATFTIAAKYYFGTPVAGAKVDWRVYREGDWEAGLFEPGLYDDLDGEELESLRGGYYGEEVAHGKGVLDGSGRLVVRVPVAAKTGAPPVERFTLSATITDASARSTDIEAAVRVAAEDRILSVQPEGYIATPGKETRVLVQASDLSGKRREGLRVTLQPGGVSGVTGPDGRAALAFTPSKVGEMRLIARSGRTEGGTTVYVLGEDASSWESAAPQNLMLLTDKHHYRPGEKAEVLLSAARPGASVLVTVEGERVYEKRLVRLAGRAARLKLPIRAEWGPNVTLSACSVREKVLSQSQTPLRVAMPARELSISVTPDKGNYGPSQSARFTVQVTDGDGKPTSAELSFSLVDEAIYALKADDAKDLKNAFWPRRINAVETRASFEVTYLSGESKSDPSVAPRRKLLDTALWLPSVKTDASGKAVVDATLPDNLTTWRATVRAVTSEAAVGYGTGKIVTTKPFFVRLELPRFLVQGDSAHALALVHNETGQSQNVALTFGSERRSLTVASGAVGKVPLPLTTGGPLTLKAWTEGSAFADGVEQSLAVRPFGRERVVNKSGVSLDGAPARFTLESDSRTLPETLSLDLRVAPSVRSVLDDSLGYLADYPYGCVEQTTSRFWPALLLGRADENRVRDGLIRLRKLQHASGAWGWFETGSDDPWMTGYALLALLDASKRGWAAQTKEPGLKALEASRKMLASTKHPLLALALARAGEGGAVVDALRRTDVKKATDTELALWVLAAVEAKKDPGDTWPELQRRAVVNGALLSWRQGKSEWDSSDRIATALGMRALLAMNPNDARAERALRWLLTSSTGESFGSTRDTAFTLSALSDWLALHPADAYSTGAPTASVNGRSVALALQPGGGFQARVPASFLRQGKNEVSLTEAWFWSGRLSGVVGKDATKGEINPEVPDGVIVERDYLRESDERPQTRFQQGENVRVRLTLTVPKELEFVAIEDAFPAGFEPTERGTAETDYGSWEFWYDFLDVRDDRIALFVRRLKPGKHVFTYHLRAQTPGRYGVLPATLAPMYVEDFVAASRGATVEVRE